MLKCDSGFMTCLAAAVILALLNAVQLSLNHLGKLERLNRDLSLCDHLREQISQTVLDSAAATGDKRTKTD